MPINALYDYVAATCIYIIQRIFSFLAKFILYWHNTETQSATLKRIENRYCSGKTIEN